MPPFSCSVLPSAAVDEMFTAVARDWLWMTGAWARPSVIRVYVRNVLVVAPCVHVVMTVTATESVGGRSLPTTWLS